MGVGQCVMVIWALSAIPLVRRRRNRREGEGERRTFEPRQPEMATLLAQWYTTVTP